MDLVDTGTDLCPDSIDLDSSPSPVRSIWPLDCAVDTPSMNFSFFESGDNGWLDPILSRISRLPCALGSLHWDANFFFPFCSDGCHGSGFKMRCHFSYHLDYFQICLVCLAATVHFPHRVIAIGVN